MAQPIAFHAPTKPAPPNIERLRNAPAEHADALLSGYELLQLLHDRGVLNLLRGLVGGGDALIGTITAAADTPEAIRAVRNFLLLTKFFASIPPDVLNSLVETVDAGAQREKSHKAPGLLPLLWRLRNENSRHAVAVALDLLGHRKGAMTRATVRVPISKVHGQTTRPLEDILAVEEPLEIRVGSRSLSVTMRTPGHDCELAAGFLFAEDIISSAAQIRGMTNSRPNVVEVDLAPDAVIKPPPSQRAFVMTSACGVCGKDSLESLAANRCPVLPPSRLKIDAGVIHRLPHQLRQEQEVFERTGGLHAAALFDANGELQSLGARQE